MDDATGVQIRQSLEHLVDVHAHKRLVEPATLFHLFEQRAALRELEHQIEVVLLAVVSDDPQNVRVLEFPQQRNFNLFCTFLRARAVKKLKFKKKKPQQNNFFECAQEQSRWSRLSSATCRSI